MSKIDSRLLVQKLGIEIFSETTFSLEIQIPTGLTRSCDVKY
jgi:hypothetical protein